MQESKGQFSKSNQVALFETEAARNATQNKSNNFPRIIDQQVSARELHLFLGSKRDFSNWIQYRIRQIGLVKNQDYTTLNKFVERTKMIEYTLTLESAKQIAMMEGTERGRMVRLYFIRCEERLREVMESPVKQPDNALQSISKLLERMDRRLTHIERKQLNDGKQDHHSMSGAIRNIRLHLGLSTVDFARILDYRNSHIIHMESMLVNVSDRMIKRLVERLHVNSNYVLFGKLPMQNHESYNTVDLLIESNKNIRELSKNLHGRR